MPNQNKQHIWLDLEREMQELRSGVQWFRSSDWSWTLCLKTWASQASLFNGIQLAQIYRRPGLEPLPWRLQQMETYVFRTCHFGFGGEALKSKKQLWRKKVRTTTSLVVSLHLSSPKNEKAAFFGLQRLEPSTHKLMASHAARRCATKPRKRLRIRLRTSCVCET